MSEQKTNLLISVHPEFNFLRRSSHWVKPKYKCPLLFWSLTSPETLFTPYLPPSKSVIVSVMTGTRTGKMGCIPILPAIFSTVINSGSDLMEIGTVTLCVNVLKVYSHWATPRTRPIPRPITSVQNSMEICVVICLGAVWSALHIIVEPIIIVLIMAIILVLGVAQCENTINVNFSSAIKTALVTRVTRMCSFSTRTKIKHLSPYSLNRNCWHLWSLVHSMNTMWRRVTNEIRGGSVQGRTQLLPTGIPATIPQTWNIHLSSWYVTLPFYYHTAGNKTPS